MHPQVSYPKCPLCLPENVGYKGRLNHPARQNHRVMSVELEDENGLQYSPYVYYREHSILFYEKHVPMKICDKTFRRFCVF